MYHRPVHEHPGIGNRLLKRNFLFFLPFLMILLTALPLQAAPLINLSPAPVFSSLAERGSNPDAMAFNSDGDLYYFGWNHGLEKLDAGQVPDGAHQLLLEKSDYASFFNDPQLSEVKNITGFGIGFNANQKVTAYIKGVYRKTGSTTDDIKIGFVSCDADGSNLETLSLTAGESFIGLNRVKKAGGGYEELDVSAGESFVPGERDLLQMRLLNVDGSEVILFTLWGVPEIFQVPSAGGSVTSFYRFPNTYPREMTVMGDDLIVTHSNGNIYRINLDSRAISDFVTKPRLMDFLGVDTGNICFTELDYEPVSNRVYCVAQVCWNDDIPQTMMAISPDGSSITKILDENSLTEYLAPIRTPLEGKNLRIQAVAVNPVAVSNGTPSLFLGDYWSGLEMVRMDLPVNSHTAYKNAPAGAYVDLDLGTGNTILGFAPFGRLEGSFHESIFLSEGENYIQILRDGVPEEYHLDILPAFTLSARCKRGKVQLTWTHRPGIVRYDIFRSSADAPDNFVKIADTVSTYSTYLDRSVTNGQTYLYTVAAVYDEHSEFSSVVASTPSLSRRPGNFNPVIYSDLPPGDTWNGTTFTYRVLAADSNNDSLVYSLSNAPAGMAIDAGGLVTWIPDASQAGIFDFAVTVTDENGGEASQAFTVAAKKLSSEKFEWVYADPDGGFVGEQTLVTVTTRIQAGSDVIPSSVCLLEYGDDYRISNDLGKLFDDGTHGDTLAGDGIFTTQIEIFENTPSVRILRVAAETGGGGEQILSDFFNVSIFEHLTDAAFSSILDIQESARQQFEEYISQGVDFESAMEETAAWIRRQPEVLQANVFLAAFNISIIYECGVVGAVSFTQNGAADDPLGYTRGGGIPDDAEVIVESSPMISFSDNIRGVGNNKVFVAGSSNAQFDSEGTDESDDIASFYKWDCRFDVSEFYDEQVTVNALKMLGDYGTIVLTGHGYPVDLSKGEIWFDKSKYSLTPIRGGQVGFKTGEKATLVNKFTHELDLLQKRLFIDDKYVILPAFIKRYCRSFPNSIVYVGSCYSSWNTTLSDAFIGSGARTYIGFSHLTYSNFAFSFARDLFSNILDDMSVNEAYGSQKCNDRQYLGKHITCCTMLTGSGDVYGSTPVFELDHITLDSVFSLGQPLDFTIRGKYFSEDSRLTIKHTDTQEEINFEEWGPVDCEAIPIEGAVFPHAGTYDVCVSVEDFSDGSWHEQCVPLIIGLPQIDDISPKDDIPINQEISIEIFGINFSGIYSIAMVDPDDIGESADFTIIDDTHISIPAHTFLSSGEYRIILTSTEGEAEETVTVADEISDGESALRATASVHWWVPEIGTRKVMVDNETPAPYTGLQSTAIDADALGADASMTAQLMTPAGVDVEQPAVHVVNTSAMIIAPHYQIDGNDLIIPTAGSGLYFQEAIEVVGAQLPDGTTVSDGTLPCHLEVSGTIDITGPLTPYQTGWGASHAYYAMRLFAAPVPDGFSLVPPLYGRWEYDAQGYYVNLFDDGLSRLTDFWVAWGDSTHGVPIVAPAGVSQSFDLPIGGRVVIYNDRMLFSVTNGNDTSSMTMNASMDLKLVPDQPGVTLIYRK